MSATSLLGPVTTINYASDDVARDFDLRGVVSAERTTRLVGMISQMVEQRPAKLLDIGCGTGRFAIPLALNLDDFTVFGADKSPRMLEEARRKPNSDRVIWLQADVGNQVFSDDSFDVILVSDVLHHLDRPVDALKECHRVLRPGGWLISKYGAMEHIAKDPEHVFFNGTTEVDALRTPTEAMMLEWVAGAGFGSTTSNTVRERIHASPQKRLAAAKAKSISVLHLIEEHQFEEGVRRLAAHVEANPDDEWLLLDTATYTCAQKP